MTKDRASYVAGNRPNLPDDRTPFGMLTKLIALSLRELDRATQTEHHSAMLFEMIEKRVQIVLDEIPHYRPDRTPGTELKDLWKKLQAAYKHHQQL